MTRAPRLPIQFTSRHSLFQVSRPTSEWALRPHLEYGSCDLLNTEYRGDRGTTISQAGKTKSEPSSARSSFPCVKRPNRLTQPRRSARPGRRSVGTSAFRAHRGFHCLAKRCCCRGTGPPSAGLLNKGSGAHAASEAESHCAGDVRFRLEFHLTLEAGREIRSAAAAKTGRLPTRKPPSRAASPARDPRARGDPGVAEAPGDAAMSRRR